VSLFERISDPNPKTESSPMLVLLHGLGSDERDLLGLAAEFDRSLRVVSLRAPYRYGGGGFAWFSIEWLADGIRVDMDQLKSSRDLILEHLVELKEEYKPSHFVLGGFSQGAIMSLACLLAKPEEFDGVILFSGRYIPDLFKDVPSAIVGKPVLVQHGTQDPVLPVSGSHEIRDELRKLGAKVEYLEYPMGHTISGQSIVDARSWLERN